METYISIKILAAVVTVAVLIIAGVVWHYRGIIKDYDEAHKKYSEIEIKLGREVYGLKQDVKKAEENYEDEKKRSDYLLKQCKDVNEIKNDMFQNNKKLGIKYRTIRTKLKNANRDLIEYNDDHFRHKRK